MSKEIFRVDGARSRGVLIRVDATHEVLRTQAGVVRGAILEQTSGPGEFNFVTIVEWENGDAIEGARRAGAALHQKVNFDAQAMINWFEIRADIANYKRVGRAMAAE
jgi:hypothetical protein